MQIERKVIKTGFEKVGNRTFVLPVTEQYLEILGFDGETLSKMNFEISIIKGKLRIEAI